MNIEFNQVLQKQTPEQKPRGQELIEHEIKSQTLNNIESPIAGELISGWQITHKIQV
jgi:hypothetical protein